MGWFGSLFGSKDPQGKCGALGHLIYDGPREGFGCPRHSYIEKGLAPSQVVARIPVGPQYPHGGYCCNDCHHMGPPPRS